jgi:hypothetical protein
LFSSKEKKKAVSRELEKLRTKSAQKQTNNDDNNLTTHLVLKHGGKAKAAMLTPKVSRETTLKGRWKKRDKIAAQKLEKHNNSSSDSNSDENVSNDKNKDSSPKSEGDDSETMDTAPKMEIADDLEAKETKDDAMEGENSENKMTKVDGVDQKNDGKCKGHTNLLEFLFEENPKYCGPGQKFEDAMCMKCEGTFTEKNTKPSSNRRIHFCPHFEDVCEAVLCHGCYIEFNTSTLTSRCKRNQS